MMMTLKENPTNSLSQPLNYNSNTINRSYSTIDYNNYHHHENPWEKPNYATFNYPQTSYSIGNMSTTGGLSSLDTTNKTDSSHSSSFNISLNAPPPSFYRRHTVSALSTSTSIYSTSTTNHPSSSPFNYSHPTTHYHPSDLFFGWNNNPSFRNNYSQSSFFSYYNPTNSATSQSTTNNKLTTRPINTPTLNYPSFLNLNPPINYSLPSSSNSSISQKKPSSTVKKPPRLTGQIRNEILKLKSNKPTVFVWEIQQNLLQNGICTAQTLPHATDIQRLLNKSMKKSLTAIIKEEPKPNVNLVMEKIFNNIENKSSSPVTICLSPSQSPTLSNGDTGSECSICLDTYHSGQEVSILSCSHEYHSSCIKEWMIKNRSCPMCRKDIHNQPQFVTLLI